MFLTKVKSAYFLRIEGGCSHRAEWLNLATVTRVIDLSNEDMDFVLIYFTEKENSKKIYSAEAARTILDELNRIETKNKEATEDV